MKVTNKKTQQNVAKRQRVKKIKRTSAQIKTIKQKQRQKVALKRGLVYLGHLPHGFYEEEIRHYFTQFGKITNVKVCRSKNTGNSKGFAYVEFAHPEVGKIAAESMNNYIMFKKRLTAEFVPQEKRPKFIFHGRQSMPDKFTKQTRRQRIIKCKNKKIDEETHVEQSQRRLTRLQKKLDRLNKLGINYDLKPVDVPTGLEKNVKKATKS